MNEFISKTLFVAGDLSCLFVILLLIPYSVYPKVKLSFIPRHKNKIIILFLFHDSIFVSIVFYSQFCLISLVFLCIFWSGDSPIIFCGEYIWISTQNNEQIARCFLIF